MICTKTFKMTLRIQLASASICLRRRKVRLMPALPLHLPGATANRDLCKEEEAFPRSRPQPQEPGPRLRSPRITRNDAKPCWSLIARRSIGKTVIWLFNSQHKRKTLSFRLRACIGPSWLCFMCVASYICFALEFTLSHHLFSFLITNPKAGMIPSLNLYTCLLRHYQ